MLFDLFHFLSLFLNILLEKWSPENLSNKVTLDHSYSLDSHHTQCSTHLLCHRGQRDPLRLSLTPPELEKITGASALTTHGSKLHLAPLTALHRLGRSSNTQKLATTEHLLTASDHPHRHTHTRTG